MNSRFLLGGTLIVFIGVLGAAFYLMPNQSVSVSTQPAAVTDNSTQSSSTSQTVTGNTTGNTTTTTSGYTMAQVATHNTASSCWAAINGNVYNLTAWISQHPGGQAPILSLCGTDGSAAFNGQHGGQARPASELKNFLLGPLS